MTANNTKLVQKNIHYFTHCPIYTIHNTYITIRRTNYAQFGTWVLSILFSQWRDLDTIILNIVN